MVRFPKDLGIGPDKLLLERSTNSIAFNLLKINGILPLNVLFLRERY